MDHKASGDRKEKWGRKDRLALPDHQGPPGQKETRDCRAPWDLLDQLDRQDPLVPQEQLVPRAFPGRPVQSVHKARLVLKGRLVQPDPKALRERKVILDLRGPLV